MHLVCTLCAPFKKYTRALEHDWYKKYTRALEHDWYKKTPSSNVKRYSCTSETKPKRTRDNAFFFKKAEVIQKITKNIYIRKDYHVQL